MNNCDFSDKTVVITGAAGRLGRRMTTQFAECGAVVAAVDVTDDIPFPRDATGRSFTADLLDEVQVERCFREIERALGPAYALVHTVGGWAGAPLLETSLNDFSQLVHVNLFSVFLCFREAARHMQGRGAGRLIGIASQQGADGGVAEQYAYSAAKAGVVRLVEAAADEFAETGLTAHAIAPSTIRFDGTDDEAAGRAGVSAQRLVDLACYLCGPAGETLDGATLRAYGSMQ